MRPLIGKLYIGHRIKNDTNVVTALVKEWFSWLYIPCSLRIIINSTSTYFFFPPSWFWEDHYQEKKGSTDNSHVSVKAFHVWPQSCCGRRLVWLWGLVWLSFMCHSVSTLLTQGCKNAWLPGTSTGLLQRAVSWRLKTSKGQMCAKSVTWAMLGRNPSHWWFYRCIRRIQYQI